MDAMDAAEVSRRVVKARFFARMVPVQKVPLVDAVRGHGGVSRWRP